ncbi:hypothetical protein PLICRDRAFT_139288 [Plicaturopsis crispa FD-325 SS-3]|nr:hypothetical protein PLICRDRAFT_139288 [Plicaturopsis crispa FD-325 SS-3]
MSSQGYESSKDLREAIKLIRDMFPIIDAGDDYLTIVGAEEQIANTAANRKKELEGTHSKLKALTRTLEAARISASRPPTVPTAEEHAAILNELDAERLNLAKAINDAEGTLSAREAELAELRQEERTLEESDPAREHVAALDASALRMQMYKGMGFEPVLGGDGKVSKILVRSQSGDVYSVPLDDTSTEAERVNKLWEYATS